MPTSNLSFWIQVVRPRDLLEITFEFRNVELTTPGGGKDGRIRGLTGSRLVVYFQSQHVAEQAIYETTTVLGPTADEIEKNPDWPSKYQAPTGEPTIPAPAGSMQALFSGPSRLVFDIPPNREIDYTTAGLLAALKDLPLVVSPIMTYQPPGCNPIFFFNPSLRPPPPKIGKPGNDVTAIEAPYRLILSPDDKARWDHAEEPVEHQGRTELWHSRMAGGNDDELPEMRAIWSPDFDEEKHQAHTNQPFRMSLDAHDRNELVHLTANWYLPQKVGLYKPLPVEADQLMLSTLGAWLKVYGDWPVVNEIELPKGELLTVEEWRHEATMGRDQYVRVVYAGYLYPYGHRASLVKITERKFFYDPEREGYTAYLFQRMFILVRQPTRTFAYREMPLRSVTIKTRITPNLNDPQNSPAIPGSGQEAFWPMIKLPDGQDVDFQFKMLGEDWEGKAVEFTSPLIFVSISLDAKPKQSGQSKSDMELVADAYNHPSQDRQPRRYRPVSGQPVAFAPAGSGKEGDTTLTTKFLSFAGPYQKGDAPHFRPELALATVDIPAVARMLGTTKSYDIKLDKSFTGKPGNPASSSIGNKGEVFAELVSPEALAFQVDKAGGLVAPDISISGLSRALGPVDNGVHDLLDQAGQTVSGKLADGAFVPEKIFPNNVKLLGGISLNQIIANDIDFGSAATAAVNGRVPGLTSEIIELNGVRTARTTYKYIVPSEGLRSDGLDLFQPGDDAELRIESEMLTPLNGDPGKFNLEGRLTDFAVVLGVDTPPAGVRIGFKQLKFVAVTDKKPDVSVDLNGVEFEGILAFVNRLSEIIPLDGFSDPPHLDITPSGIELGYSVGLPMTAVGIFSLQNISLSAGVFLPLISAKPLNFSFAFCERHQPFLLTVSLFGGGGFFGMEIGLDGLRMVEAALEFGAAAAINLGVASGALSFMGGVYFQKAGGGKFELTGYFRANGSLSVLGLITVSVEFYLGLTYTSKTPAGPHAGAMWGQAKLTVKIKILFFSKSVSIAMEREFAGSDPYFAQLVAPDDWTEYCLAFADY